MTSDEHGLRQSYMFTLRVSPALAARVKECAAAQRVSINQLLTWWVRQGLRDAAGAVQGGTGDGEFHGVDPPSGLAAEGAAGSAGGCGTM